MKTHFGNCKSLSQCGIAAGIGFPSGKVQGRDMTAICKNSFRIIKPHMNEQILFEELQQSQADGCMAVGIDLDSLADLKTGDDAGHFGDFTKAYDKELLKEVRKSVSVPFYIKRNYEYSGRRSRDGNWCGRTCSFHACRVWA